MSWPMSRQGQRQEGTAAVGNAARLENCSSAVTPAQVYIACQMLLQSVPNALRDELCMKSRTTPRHL